MELLTWLLLICLGARLSSSSSDLNSFLDDVETQLDSFHNETLRLYQERCSVDCTKAFSRYIKFKIKNIYIKISLISFTLKLILTLLKPTVVVPVISFDHSNEHVS